MLEKMTEIPFNAWSEERIKQGRKKSTARHKKYPGDSRVICISQKMPWHLIKKYFWQCEGADSPEELQSVIEQIYGRKVLDSELFYLHFGDFK